MRIPEKPPDFNSIWTKYRGQSKELYRSLFGPTVSDLVRRVNDRYLHWDRMRFQKVPPGLEPEMVWAAIQASREPHKQELPITFAKEKRLWYWIPPQHYEWT